MVTPEYLLYAPVHPEAGVLTGKYLKYTSKRTVIGKLIWTACRCVHAR